MSRLHELIEQAKISNPELGKALAEEVAHLENQPTFGLVFERHAPEATELYGRPVAPGDKVHVLNERGSTAKADPTLWRVSLVDGTGIAHLIEDLPGNQEWNAGLIGREPNTKTTSLEDLVVVAEHTDTIYPGLVETGRVDNGPEDAPAHTVINAENLHALQALTYTHRHSIDCIYIDPPYNTGARDWKYNNDYVGKDDDYRHSKWLSFLEKRLLIASELLDPNSSVLIVTIDEKEYLRLGLLLEQVFPSARIQMVSSVISAKGSARSGEFSRANEYIYFVMLGGARPIPTHDDMLSPEKCDNCADSLHLLDAESSTEVEWARLKRNGKNGRRSRAKSGFYPIFLNADSTLHSVGRPLGADEDWRLVSAPEGTFAILPIQAKGDEQSWGISADKIEEYYRNGFIKFGKIFPKKQSQKAMVYYLTEGPIKQALSGEIVNKGTNSNPRWVHQMRPERKPFSVWNRDSHDAGWQGTRLLDRFLPNRDFDYAKSLYAVEDTLRFFVSHKPNAVILDFFAGSGTTAHAVMRLNRQDGGNRKSIMITNNEVSADEQNALREIGLRPGDAEWEALGISEYMTKPRVTAAITGKTPSGEPIKGDYKFTDEFPMSDGFEANARFFTLEYLNPVMVSYGYAFSRIAPLLWLRAGQVGPIITDLPDHGWDVTDRYAVIEDCDDAEAFTAAVKARPGLTHVFIITDNASVYKRIAQGLDENIEAIQLYESYLTNFAINASRVLH